VTLYIVRHAVAVAKDRWTRSDVLRPLTAKGVRQSEALATWFAGTGADPDGVVEVVVSSPTVRCVATVLGLTRPLAVEVRTDAALAVGDPDGAAALARGLLASHGCVEGPAAVLCSHGEVIPGLLEALTPFRATHSLQNCAKGSVWALSTNAAGPIARYHDPSSIRAEPSRGPAMLRTVR
jgi:8-oxo-dGTP diphosphatase